MPLLFTNDDHASTVVDVYRQGMTRGRQGCTLAGTGVMGGGKGGGGGGGRERVVGWG